VIVTLPLSGPPALSVRNGPRELVIPGSSGRSVISGIAAGAGCPRDARKKRPGGRGKRPLLGRDFRAVAAVVVVVVTLRWSAAVLLRRRVESAHLGMSLLPRYVPPSHLWDRSTRLGGLRACARWYLHARPRPRTQPTAGVGVAVVLPVRT